MDTYGDYRNTGPSKYRKTSSSFGLPTVRARYNGDVPEDFLVDKALSLVENQGMKHDKNTFLLDASSTGHNSTATEGYQIVPDEGPLPQFIKAGMASVPDYINNKIREAVQYLSFPGLLPQISRAFVTADSKLYFWNYFDGSDFVCFEEVKQIISNVGLVAPKSGIFPQQTEWILVVSTSVEILLIEILGISIASMEARLSEYSVASDDVQMTKIVGTKEGRIFMGGLDGHLYEILYGVKEHFFQKKCRKICHTSNGLLSIFKFGQGDPIQDVVVDDSRRLVYTLTKSKSEIQVYSLGEKGDDFIPKYKCKDLYFTIKRELPNIKEFRVINVFPITETESKQYQLQAITDSGIRIFLSTSQDAFSISGSNNTLSVRAVKLAPANRSQAIQTAQSGSPYPQQSSSPFAGTPMHDRFLTERLIHNQTVEPLEQELEEVSRSLYSKNVTILNVCPSEDQSTLIFISLDPKLCTNLWAENASENASFLCKAPGGVWDLSEDENNMNKTSIYYRNISSTREGSIHNEIITQHFLPAKQYILLTSFHTHVLSKMRPIDNLVRILNSSNGKIDHRVKLFIEEYGHIQTCIMAILLASTNVETVDAKHPNLRNWATSLSLECSRQASAERANNSSMFGFFQPSTASMTVGQISVALLLHRYLRPILHTTIITHATGKSAQFTFSPQEMGEIAQYLSSLKDFINQNPQVISKGSRGGNTNENFDAEEEARLSDGLHLLINRSLQAVLFLQNVNDFIFPNILQQLTSNGYGILSGMTVKEFMKEQGQKAAQELLQTITSLSNRMDTGEELLSQILQKNSQFYFSTADRDRLQAEECLEKAKNTPVESERTNLLNQSVQLYKKAATGNASIDNVVREYKALNYPTGIVEVALAQANKGIISSENSARFFLNNCPEGDADLRREFDRRRNYYGYVLSLLHESFDQGNESFQSMRSEIIPIIKKSNDVCLHYVIYDWYISMDEKAKLIQDFKGMTTAHLENYLNGKGTIDDLEILTTLYTANEKWGAASKTFAQLSSLPNVPLHQRSNYILRAYSLCKLANFHINDHNYATLIQDKVILVQLQMKIKDALSESRDIQYQTAARELEESDVMEISKLYRYTQTFGLHELQLEVLKNAETVDQSISNCIQENWRKIIRQEPTMASLSNKVKSLGDILGHSEAFPVEFLIAEMEKENMTNGKEERDAPWVIHTMLNLRISFRELVRIYDQLLDSSEWNEKAKMGHIGEMIVVLVKMWRENIRSMGPKDANYNKETNDFTRVVESVLTKRSSQLKSVGEEEVAQSMLELRKFLSGK
ncbi:nucleoporin [Planoprotostelium fungivorum]|uniref:Nucleoporin n=1 Tax=Planoprotostelium fungivorum TaxID=1890364 RepID=A0A2P6NI54_9EUKA|nr:nucleoporin [Planoprotostelium fungivorum]